MFKIEVKGLDQLLTKVKAMPKEIQEDVDIVIGGSVQKMERTAKSLAPVNDGHLKSNIGHSQLKPMTWELFSAAPYSAYMEFGTKKKFDSVTGYEKLAEAAKGKGDGSYKQFIDSLTRWVEKKIGKKNARSIAFAIAKKIIVDGVNGNHYFTRAIESEKPNMMKNLKAAINK